MKSVAVLFSPAPQVYWAFDLFSSVITYLNGPNDLSHPINIDGWATPGLGLHVLVGQHSAVQFCGQVIQGDQLILHVLNVFNKFAVVESLQDERLQNSFSGRPPIRVRNSARGGAGMVITHHTYRYAGKYVG